MKSKFGGCLGGARLNAMGLRIGLLALVITGLSGCGDDTTVIPAFDPDANNGDDVSGFNNDVAIAKDVTSIDYDGLFQDSDVNPLFDAESPDGDALDTASDATTTTPCLTGTDCVALSTPCTPSACVDGFCQAAELPNSATCEDGDACTTLQTCLDGKCQGGIGQNCDDGNPCSEDQCDLNHGCQHALLNGGPCDDGNACTVGHICAFGQCTSTAALDCNDQNACTADTCDATIGCVHAVLNGGACDDGNSCTIGDVCVESACTPGAGKLCDDGNACTTDGCDLAGDCTSAFNAAPCDDGNACSKDDICASGACTGTGF